MRQSVIFLCLLVSVCLLSLNNATLSFAQEEPVDRQAVEEPVVVIVGDDSDAAIPEADAQLTDGEETKAKGKKTDEAAIEAPEAATMATAVTSTTGSDDEAAIVPILVENAALE